MNKFKVISMNVGHMTVRWIDSPWFEEEYLEKPSVKDGAVIAEDDFFSCFRDPVDNKLLNVVKLEEHEDEVIAYNALVNMLRMTKRCKDPIGKIHLEAASLKASKGATNEFFADTPSVVRWIIEKSLNLPPVIPKELLHDFANSYLQMLNKIAINFMEKNHG